ncbi:lasso peptide biosynthesis B2 protein [Okeania sp.]|uniref:lasso peptide biosynthesis B2 protein n=1 Tax=Okeania sp. TaxID=3100323 RepID=UPI002B4AF24E|nr:lasso peptide biosynthesis B2 protein [Okeania sp.]MEB3342863.1 lasso peptide biosynthesis B2 protein [Okeania sp.]
MEQLLLVKAFLLLAVIRVGLKFLPFQTLYRLLAKVFQPTAKLQISESTYAEKVVWTVRVASRYVRGVRCLAQALATQVLLEQRGYSSNLRIGFTRNKGGRMSAHAWVESEGRVVIGDLKNMADYIRVPLQGTENLKKKEWRLLS